MRSVTAMTGHIIKYHDATSYTRHKMGGHYLDWGNQPSVFKGYPGIEPIPLSKEVDLPEQDLPSVIRWKGSEAAPRSLTAEDLSRIMLLTYTFTARARHGGGDFYYRSAASAGALYPTELYVAACGIGGLDDGVYHFSIAHHGLNRLRKGAPWRAIMDAAPASGIRAPALSFFLTAIFFRSAWKYRDRSYRYDLLDTGHVAENLILALRALDLPHVLTYDFDDREVNHLLGLDEEKEVCLAVCHVPGQERLNGDRFVRPEELPSAVKAASRTALAEKGYATVMEIHRKGEKVSHQKEAGFSMSRELGPTPVNWDRIKAPGLWLEAMPLARSVFRRRSRRNFVPDPLPRDSLTALAEALCTDLPERALRTPARHEAVGVGLVVGNTGDMEPGFYLLDMAAPSMALVAPGDQTGPMARVCLDQAWLGNAAVHLLFMANLEKIEDCWGPRGYRYALLEAGRMGERIYLAATAMGLGCCGIGAFYDPEAAELLNLNRVSRLLYLVAVGPVKSAPRS